MNDKISIRKSIPADLEKIMPVYESAKSYMRREGNMSQWTGGYPSEEVILKDMAAGNHYIMENGYGEVAGVFTFIIGEDPTYKTIEGGEWLDDSPYGTIHRIASTGKTSGLLGKCVEFCFRLIPNIRIDTHKDNRSMLNAITNLRFERCGVIYLADGSPRVAFQKLISGTTK